MTHLPLSISEINALLDLAPLGISTFEFNTFIATQHLGRARQVRAVLKSTLELENTKTSLLQHIELENTKTSLLQHNQLENELDKLSELDKLETDELSYLGSLERQLKEADSDLQIHYAWLGARGKVALTEAMTDFEESESDYWVSTIATQGAIDILTDGKISEDTIKRIMLLKKDDFEKTVITAIKISKKVQESIVAAEHKLQGTE